MLETKVSDRSFKTGGRQRQVELLLKSSQTDNDDQSFLMCHRYRFGIVLNTSSIVTDSSELGLLAEEFLPAAVIVQARMTVVVWQTVADLSSLKC